MSYPIIGVFITTLMMVGILTLPLEIKYFGARVAVLRNILYFIGAIVIGIVIGAGARKAVYGNDRRHAGKWMTYSAFTRMAREFARLCVGFFFLFRCLGILFMISN
ncbi:MAG: hypothetical protein A2041_08450 [Bacteroidetes bacterium GWA2_31_9b]|nr:MAG: hypothetical protein A2041_08450 [Bacteroidetes bacterium GWA2_31_9b]